MATQRRHAAEEPRPPAEDAENVLELYADSMNIGTGLYTATLSFGELRPGKPALVKARIRVSPHMLKAISLLTAKHVRTFEESTGGPIRLPNQLVHDWGLEEEIR